MLFSKEERLSGLEKLSKTWGYPNNSYFHRGLAFETSNVYIVGYWFKFIDGDKVAEVKLDTNGNACKLQRYRIEKNPLSDNDFFELDYEVKNGPVVGFEERIDKTIQEALSLPVEQHKQEWIK